MKPRNREVNIFNVSLLDILCGALGAFCFLTLGMLPYYKPDTKDVTKAKVDTRQLEERIDELLRQMRGMSNIPPEMAARLQEMARQFQALQQQTQRLKNLLQQAQAQGAAYRRQAEQARAEAEQLRRQNRQLSQRNPVTVVLTYTTRGHDVDLYVQDSKAPPPDPTRDQGRTWRSDTLFNCNLGPCSDVWMMRDVPRGDYKVFYKFLKHGSNPEPARTTGYYLHNGSIVYFPSISLAQDQKTYFVGTIQMKEDGGTRFEVAPEFAEVYRQQMEETARRQRDREQQAPGN